MDKRRVDVKKMIFVILFGVFFSAREAAKHTNTRNKKKQNSAVTYEAVEMQQVAATWINLDVFSNPDSRYVIGDRLGHNNISDHNLSVKNF